MKNLTRFAIFLLLMFPAGKIFAQGGACPAGANYANATAPLKSTLTAPVTLASLGVSSCFYISAAGADTNSGTSESSPWAHAPGMPNCSGNCANTNPKGGEGFIFRGGDAWHFGNSGAAPSTGGTWSVSSNGGSGSPIYFGIDPTWFSGSAWARPVLTGDNPLTPHPGTYADSVSSCAYQTGGGNNMVDSSAATYVTFDNFEFTGMCQKDIGAPWSADIYMHRGGTGTVYEHLYFHGWTHVPFSASGTTWNMEAMQGGQGETTFQCVVDGSDSDPGGGGAFFEGGSVVSQSVFRYTSQIVTTTMHSIHDNLFEHWFQPSDGLSHGNVLESSGEPASNNAVYNNVFRYIGTDCNGCSFVNFWPQPSVGYTDYFFNNVEYNTSPAINGNYFNVGQNSNSGAQGTIDSFNNTWENTTEGAIMTCDPSGYPEPATFSNNHYITDGGSAYVSCPSSTVKTSELLQTHSQASGQGYTASAPYAFSPPASSGPTISAGTNVSSTFCGTLSGSSDPVLQAAGAACQLDTRYACVYVSTSHTVACSGRGALPRSGGGWSIGAYQSGVTPAAATNARANVP